MKLRHYCSAVILAKCLLVVLSAHAQGSISISPPPNAKEVKIEEVRNYIGSCGSAAVLLYGVTDTQDGHFKVDDTARLVVRIAPAKALDPIRQVELTASEGALSDTNGLACVKYAGSSRLLLWSNCAQSSCGQGNSYYVIDPEIAALLAPKRRGAHCEEKCAMALLGGKLPRRARD